MADATPTATADATINYTIPTGKSGHRPAVTVSLTVTYDPDKPNANGSFDITGFVSGTYTTTTTTTVKGVTSTSVSTVEITGIKHLHRRGNNDNRIFPNASSTAKLAAARHFVDQHGITFTIDDPLKGHKNHVAEVNFFYSAEYGSYRQYGHKVSGDATDVTLTTSSGTTASPAATESTLVAAAVCYAAGTRIRTTRGDVAVEALAIGDVVVTAAGAERPIRWLGHRTIECGRHPRPSEALPVRIAAHAFGASRPARDLIVSPGHAICVDVLGDTLIPAASLINDTSIVQMAVARVTYWHVELDSHDVILAENLACESYLEMGNRRFFAESGVVALALSPDAPIATHADFCRPFQADGPLVDAVRAQLAVRAAGTRRARAAA